MEKGAELTEEIGKMKKAEEESKARLYSLIEQVSFIFYPKYLQFYFFWVAGQRRQDQGPGGGAQACQGGAAAGEGGEGRPRDREGGACQIFIKACFESFMFR